MRSCDKQIGVGLEAQTKTVISEITILLTATAILKYIRREDGKGGRDKRMGGAGGVGGMGGATFSTLPLILQ